MHFTVSCFLFLNIFVKMSNFNVCLILNRTNDQIMTSSTEKCTFSVIIIIAENIKYEYLNNPR